MDKDSPPGSSKAVDILVEGGYALVICEKPDAAKRVAEALKDDKLSTREAGRISVFLVENVGRRYVVCSAAGHLYTVADPAGRREAYPVFDVEWIPSHLVKKGGNAARRLEVIKRLSQNASSFIHSCDFDLEGETIGYNILKYACGGQEKKALRAKFSTLTYDELRKAFATARVGLGGRSPEAGRTRHVVDFIWGVNLSRALSEAFHAANGKYRMVSVGRVQSPTLAYVVDREVRIRTFVPVPYWTVTAQMEKGDQLILAEYEKDRVDQLREAQEVKETCEGRMGVVSEVHSTVVRQMPPTPFNIGDLQREAYRVFGFSPSQTLVIDERLYLDALISYPRTSSQKLPPSIGYKKILQGLSRSSQYRQDAQDLIAGRIVPHEGEKDDPAHPAIYPTGESPKWQLEARGSKLYDLIVRRFFAVFGEEVARERVSATISVEKHKFKFSCSRMIKDGWLKYYGKYLTIEDRPVPVLSEGEGLR